MPEPVSTSTAAISGGAMVTTGASVANLVVFNDIFYLYLAGIGAVVSMFGVLHEVLKNRPIQHAFWQIVVEIIKGLILGVMAIPFWYLILSNIGEALLSKVLSIEVNGMANSVWLMVSFAASWYTVPLYDWLVSKVKREVNKDD